MDAFHPYGIFSMETTSPNWHESDRKDGHHIDWYAYNHFYLYHAARLARIKNADEPIVYQSTWWPSFLADSCQLGLVVSMLKIP